MYHREIRQLYRIICMKHLLESKYCYFLASHELNHEMKGEQGVIGQKRY
jgi:hypothetical protein